MDLDFIGRLHPVVVHLPIGILLIALFFEILSRREKFRFLDPAVNLCLFWGSVFAVASTVTGLIHSGQEAFEKWLVTRHQVTAIITTFLGLVTYIIRSNPVLPTKLRAIVLNGCYILLGLSVLATGHLGGTITHGEGFLFSTSYTVPQFNLPEDRGSAVLYADIINPILARKCTGCHGPRKSKAELRLDSYPAILAGGESGHVISPGSESGELLDRIRLPANDNDHMPPSGRAQLSPAEKELIRLWVTNGASENERVAAISESTKVLELMSGLVDGDVPVPVPDWMPTEVVSPPVQEALRNLTNRQISYFPVAQGSPYYKVTFTNKPAVSVGDMEAVVDLGPCLVELDLSYTHLTDSVLAPLIRSENLRRLRLDHTQVTDAGMMHLTALEHLQYLNLCNTDVGPSGVGQLKPLRSLRELILFQTAVSVGDTAFLTDAAWAPRIILEEFNLPELATDTIVYRAR